MALYSLYCAEVPLRNCSLTHDSSTSLLFNCFLFIYVVIASAWHISVILITARKVTVLGLCSRWYETRLLINSLSYLRSDVELLVAVLLLQYYMWPFQTEHDAFFTFLHQIHELLQVICWYLQYSTCYMLVSDNSETHSFSCLLMERD